MEKSDESPRVLFFDLETQKSAAEVGGWSNSRLMKLAVGVVWDSREEKHFSYLESEAGKLTEKLRSADLVMGFNVIRFDYCVLQPYSSFDLREINTFDMLVDVHKKLGYRLSLNHLAEHTLGAKKSADGLLSLQWYKEGKIDKIVEYCKKDVEITRDLFLFGEKNGFVNYKSKGKSKNVQKLSVDWKVPPTVQQGIFPTPANLLKAVIRMHDPAERSELELRFEELFKRTFGRSVEDILKPQYPVEVYGSKYYIDYAYISNSKKIAIELDGHGKIKEATKSAEAFKRLLDRQNKITHAGFIFYRFTWTDVVENDGKKVIEELHSIFKEVGIQPSPLRPTPPVPDKNLPAPTVPSSIHSQPSPYLAKLSAIFGKAFVRVFAIILSSILAQYFFPDFSWPPFPRKHGEKRMIPPPTPREDKEKENERLAPKDQESLPDTKPQPKPKPERSDPPNQGTSNDKFSPRTESERKTDRGETEGKQNEAEKQLDKEKRLEEEKQRMSLMREQTIDKLREDLVQPQSGVNKSKLHTENQPVEMERDRFSNCAPTAENNYSTC